MKMKRSSLLIKYAELTGEFYGNSTTLCELFWAIVGSTLMILLCVFLVLGLAVGTYRHPRIVLSVVGILGSLALIGWIFENDLVRTAYDGFKRRFCPIITLED